MQISPLVLLLIVPVLLVIASAMWAYGDAKKRGKPAILVALVVALGAWPTGLIAWLLFRPDTDRPSRRFNLDDYRQQ